MNLLDSFVESFSSRELKSRVRGVVLLGSAILAAAAVAGYLFLTAHHTLVVEGAAIYDASKPDRIAVVVSSKNFSRINPELSPSVAFGSETGLSPGRYETSIISMDPSKNEIEIGTPGFVQLPSLPGRFGLEIYLIDLPYWKLLWGSFQG